MRKLRWPSGLFRRARKADPFLMTPNRKGGFTQGKRRPPKQAVETME